MANKYDVGEPVRCYTETPFQDAEGTPFDPGYVRFKARKPDDTPITYVYQTDPELVRNDVGDFEVILAADVAGHWHYRFEAMTEEDGDLRGASEGTFIVNSTKT